MVCLKIGAMLKEQEKQHGARGIGKKVELHDETPPLADQGTTYIESHRWQQVAVDVQVSYRFIR